VAETVPFKYRAFLSYSHRDTAWAKWLHSRLEGFRIDQDLIGRATPVGAVPQTLRPIFRDREDFSGGYTLTEATITALDASAALIVLCSTVSAGRPAVNEEVRLFRSRHPDRPVIPVIIDGTWPDNFPPALRYELAADGTTTDRPITILGPDLRENADGKNLGFAKTVAGLTGLAPDDVYRRAERERRKQARLRAGVAAVIVALAIVGGGSYWRSYQQEETLKEISALVDKYSPVPSAQAAPGAKQSLTQAITSIVEGAATDPRYAQALALLKAGKPEEAEPLLKAVAEDRERRAGQDAKDAASAYRNLASIAAASDPGRARDYYARAAQLDPSDIDGLYQNGWFQELAGQLDAAQAAYAQVIATAKPGADDQDLVWAKFGMGDIKQHRGDLGAALVIYREVESIAERLAKSDPGNPSWQRELAVSYGKVGEVLVAQGNLPEALASHQASLAIMDGLTKSDPGNPDWQRELAVSYAKIGDVQQRQHNLPAALAAYQAGQAIFERLAKADPNNTDWQDDLSVSYARIGDVQVAQGDFSGALKSNRDSLAIAERLAKSDTGNARWQRELAVSYNNVGNVQMAQGDLQDALASYQADLAIMERLAKSDTGNAGWQRELAVSYNNVGNVQVAQGHLPEALASYQADLAIMERLVKSDTGNAGWQRDLVVSYVKIAGLDPSEARAFLTRAVEIVNQMQSHGQLAPTDAWMPADLARRIAELPKQ
jgi:tetratricopeptide (TPR) repeat protein